MQVADAQLAGTTGGETRPALPTTLLTVTALAEAGTGLVLLVAPAVVVALLFNIERTAPVTLLVARLAGAALVAIGIACWFGRNSTSPPASRGLLAAVFVYDVAAAALLAYGALALSLAGIALWPAVVLHGALAAWCAASFREPQ